MIIDEPKHQQNMGGPNPAESPLNKLFNKVAAA